MPLCRILLIGLALCFATLVRAQGYPDRPIRLIAPFPAGGLADVLARAVGDEMSKSLGQPVIVENRAGAGGNTGADAAAKSAPDGYTLLMSSAGILTANQFLYAKMPFDAETAFVPVSNVAGMSMLVVVNPKVEAKTLKEFVALAKAQPGKINFGSPGIGTTGHLGLAMLCMQPCEDHACALPRRGAGSPICWPGRSTAWWTIRRLSLHTSSPAAASAGGGGEGAHGVVAGCADGRRAGGRQLRGLVLVRRGRARRYAARDRRAIAPGDRRGGAHHCHARAFGKSGARLLGNSPQDFAAQIRAERASWGEIIKAANIAPQ
jgi:hypothetical protein